MDRLDKIVKFPENEHEHWNYGVTSFPQNFGDDLKSHSAFRLLFLIATFYKYKKEKEFSQTYLSEISGLSKQTIKESIKELISIGYIEKTKNKTSISGAFYRIISIGPVGELIKPKNIKTKSSTSWAKKIKMKHPSCVRCQSKENLHAHHITPSINRYTISNGTTLCLKCHFQYHKKYKKRIMPETLNEFIERKQD